MSANEAKPQFHGYQILDDRAQTNKHKNNYTNSQRLDIISQKKQNQKHVRN